MARLCVKCGEIEIPQTSAGFCRDCRPRKTATAGVHDKNKPLGIGRVRLRTVGSKVCKADGCMVRTELWSGYCGNCNNKYAWKINPVHNTKTPKRYARSLKEFEQEVARIEHKK